MKKLKDILYDYNDILIALAIMVIAALLIMWRISAIVEYPREFISDNTEVSEPAGENGESGETEKAEKAATLPATLLSLPAKREKVTSLPTIRLTNLPMNRRMSRRKNPLRSGKAVCSRAMCR